MLAIYRGLMGIESPKETIIEVKRILSLFDKRITPTIDKEDTSPISKVPYKLLSLRGLYQMRIPVKSAM